MTDKEKRSNSPIHPRYQVINRKMLEESSMDTSKHGSFGVRSVIAVLLFVLYVAMDYQGYETLSVDSHEITQEIERDFLGLLEK